MKKANTQAPAPRSTVTEHVWGETKGFVAWIRMPGDSDSPGGCTSEFRFLIKHRGSGFYPLANKTRQKKINGIGQTLMNRSRNSLPTNFWLWIERVPLSSFYLQMLMLLWSSRTINSSKKGCHGSEWCFWKTYPSIVWWFEKEVKAKKWNSKIGKTGRKH